MAETVRTWSDILALLADNETGEISAQDLRDALFNTYLCWGSLVHSGLGGTTLTFGAGDDDEQVVGYDRVLDEGGIDASGTTDDMTILAGGDGIYKVEYGVSLDPGSNVMRIYLRKGASRFYTHNPEPQVEGDGSINNLSMSGVGYVTGAVEGDTYSMWLERVSGTTSSVQIHSAYFNMTRVK